MPDLGRHGRAGGVYRLNGGFPRQETLAMKPGNSLVVPRVYAVGE